MPSMRSPGGPAADAAELSEPEAVAGREHIWGMALVGGSNTRAGPAARSPNNRRRRCWPHGPTGGAVARRAYASADAWVSPAASSSVVAGLRCSALSRV